MKTLGEYKALLESQMVIINRVLEEQKRVHEGVNHKAWKELSSSMAECDALMDKFNALDAQRDAWGLEVKDLDDEARELLRLLKAALLKCRIENKAMEKYLDISRGFVQGVIEKGLSKSRNKLYSPKGYKNNQPKSIVINALF